MKHTPEDILDAVVDLFDRDGVGVSMAKVATAAGVSNGTLYNYFPTKQALLDGLYVRLKNELADTIGDPDPSLPLREQFRHIWQRSFDWAMADPARQRVSVLLRDADLISPEADAIGAARFLTIGKMLQEAVDEGLLVDLPLDYLAALTLRQLELAITSGLSPAERDLAFDVAWNGITRR